MCVNVFYTTRNEISAGSDKRQRHDVTEIGDFYNGGLWGKFSCFYGSSWNFVSGYIKNVDTHNESFSYKKTRNKKVTAKNPLTNLYEMNSTFEGHACTHVFKESKTKQTKPN